MPFGQVVIGPPGSGKTTYCAGVQQLLGAAQRRVALVNLDPANDLLPYAPAVDVCDLVCLESVMQQLGLGPNGGELARAGPSCCQNGALPAPITAGLRHRWTPHQPVECNVQSFAPGLVYCIEYLEANTDWLFERLAPLIEAGAYLVFDCPGQVREQQPARCSTCCAHVRTRMGPAVP